MPAPPSAFVAAAPLGAAGAPGAGRAALRPRGRPALAARRPRRAAWRAAAPPRAAAAPATPPAAPLAPIDEPLGPAAGARFAPRRWTEGLRGDLRRRLPLYLSDWRDGLRIKAVPAVLFMFFACLAPVTAFGALNAVLTGGNLGVVECIVACGGSGMLYAAFAGQPLTFLAPTGLTLAFTAALYGFTETMSLPFMATYGWVGVWTSLILLLLTIVNASDIIKHCTRWTDEIFNSLIATNFLYEATRALLGAFAVAGANKTVPFATLSLALSTVVTARALSGMRASRFFFRRMRNFLSDFGPFLAIASMSAVAAIPAVANLGLERLAIPSTFALSNGRAWLVPLLSVPWSVRLACLIPALLLTCLFYLDQNITVRVVNSPSHRLRKGPAFHLDMLILAACTFLCSITGLPLMCAGTIQSLNHVKALTTFEQVLDSEGRLTGQERVKSVMENRLTGFAIHGLILSSLLLLPVLKLIPMAVISGVFLYLGVNMLTGNEFLARIPILFMDKTRYPPSMPPIPPSQTNAFTLMQTACLALLWVLKLNKRTAMYFPSVIALCMLIRSLVAPRFFSAEALAALDGSLETADERATDGADADDRSPALLASQW